MSRNVVLSLTLLAALAATGCGSMVAADCQLQSSANGPYIIKFTGAGSAATGCATDTPDVFGDQWTFDPFDKGLIVALNTRSDLPDPPDSQSSVYAKGHFDQAFPPADQICTVGDMTHMQVSPTENYVIHQLGFLNTATYLGTTFNGSVTYTHNACTRDYTAQALSPLHTCATKEDCDPFSQPFASGINSQYDTDCNKETWATDITGDTATGICFFVGAFPGTGGWKPVQ